MILLASGFEIINDFSGQRRGADADFGEQGECGGFDFCGPNSGVGQTASGAYVRSDVFMVNPPYSNSKEEYGGSTVSRLVMPLARGGWRS